MAVNPMRPISELIKTATLETFNSLVIQGSGPMVVEFMTYGCAHCQTIEPILREVAESLGTKAKLFRVNIAVEDELSQNFQIEGTPTLVMFRDGKEVGRFEGPPPNVSGILSLISDTFRT